jgi:broad specificity phosphatase PhoE
MLKRFALAGIGLLALFVAVQAGQTKTYPAHILIIRHAEKPEGDTSVSLSTRGKERARALRNLFKKSETRPKKFPTPDFIFATKDSKNSHRPKETVTPLAKRLKLTIDDSYANADFKKLAKEILENPKYAGKTVLICWHHGTMPELAQNLKATDAPKHLKDTVFDRVWRIEYDKAGKARFRDMPQQLLAGDSAK